MQHTEKRNFNIIETSDAFSPEALNENARKFEAALDAAEAHADAGDAALDQRVTVLEAKRFASITYTGDGVYRRKIELGFTPAVLLMTENLASSSMYFVLPGYATHPPVGDEVLFGITEGGFMVSGYNANYNTSGSTYHCIAFA